MDVRINSLTTRFLLALLLSTALPFLAFGLYVSEVVRDREEQQAVSVYLPGWADEAARKISDRLEYAWNVGWILAKQAERRLADDELEEFEEHVNSLYGAVGRDFEMVLLADSRGQVLRTMGLWGGRPLGIESVARFEWFQKLNGSVPAPRAWVDRHVSPLLHLNSDRESRDPTDYSLGLGFAVQMRGGEYGALYILLGWQEIQNVLDESAGFLRTAANFANASAFLAGPNGDVLGHSDRGRYGEVLSPPSLLNEVSGSRSGFARFDSETTGENGVAFTTVATMGSVWRVGLHAPTSELFRVSREFGRWLMFVMLMIGVLMVGLALRSSRALVRPLRRLSDATRQVAQGDLDARVEVRGGGELADLGRAFNTMAVDLAQSQEQLRDAERQAAWAEMARQIAHEIKNPLTPMRMSAQMLLRARREKDARSDDLADRLAKIVLEQTDELDRIATDFQQFAGSPQREVQVYMADDLLRGLQELVSGMSEASSVNIEFRPDASGAAVRVDVQEMRRVFLNLIHNAIHACGKEGNICVSSKLHEDAAEFYIEDDGPGVPDDVRERLFEPYFTTKTSGTGLGLAICRKIVEAHGGDVRLASSVPNQTIFLLSLPLAHEGDPSPGESPQ